MSAAKISAGTGYEYLTRQTASNDTVRKGQKLSDYYSEKGERPGQWIGSGLGSLGLSAGGRVTQEQMGFLFGEGMRPDADTVQAQYVAAQHEAGRTGKKSQAAVAREAQDAARLGQKFRDYSGGHEASEFTKRTAEAFAKYNTDPQFRATFGPSPAARGEDPDDAKWAELSEGPRPARSRIPDQVRSQIRTQIGRETFAEQYGRQPVDARELHAHITRESRPQAQAVSGYDLTFSPVKSVSVLWAIAPRDVGRAIEEAHEKAIQDAITWTEQHVAGTRRGTNGIRSTDVHGLVATAFVHRDSRSGDPDLHTHVAVSAKVQDAQDGQWRALDGAMLYKHMVAISERYNSALEEHLTRDLGLGFRTRQSLRKGAKQDIREVAGVPDELIEGFSSRTADIDREFARLSAKFESECGRAPTNKEALRLYEQANDRTRQAKHEPKSHAEQQQEWRQTAAQLLGGEAAVDAAADEALQHAQVPTKTLSEAQMRDLAGQVIASVETSRARFQYNHVHAETERRVKALGLDPDVRTVTVSQVEALALAPENVVRIDARQEVTDPAPFLRAAGDSQFDKRETRLYATTRVMAAEERIVAAAQRRQARVIDPETVATSLLESTANGRELNQGQAEMVSQIATTDRCVTAVVAPAGSGKTTSMAVLSRAWNDSGGHVIGFGPSAVAARELGGAIDTTSDTLSKLVWHLRHPEAPAPAWVGRIGPQTLMLIDEAGMAGTMDLDLAIGYATGRGAKVALVGDTKQLSAVAAGGVLRDVAHEVGALSLTELMRFQVPGEGNATLGLRRGDVETLGWYLDQDRVRAVTGAAPHEAIYQAWREGTADGHEALMIAHQNKTVDELNRRARADLIAAGRVDPTHGVQLVSGLSAAAGDVIVTRQNDRSTQATATDWVKNGDRWTVQEVLPDGSLRVQHHQHRRHLVLDADYVRRNVDLGYAATVHGAQGQTVDHCHVLIHGSESQELLYVGLSRGRHGNWVYVPIGGDGDAHQEIFQHFEVPPTAVELLENVIRRDGSQVSAMTEKRHQADPAFLLGRATATYDESLNVAAIRTVGTERMGHIQTEADRLLPGLSAEPAWDTLAGHLAVLELRGQDPVEQLREAIADRELDTARDKAAVLDWRLDTSQNHSAGRGPLPWLMGIPQVLADDAAFGQVLTARSDVVTAYARAHAEQITAADPADRPEWAHELDEHPGLLRDVAIWRAATGVPDEERSPLGPPPPASRQLRYYQLLAERVEVALGPRAEAASELWQVALTHTPHLVADPWSPVLRERLAMGVAAGADVPALLQEALGKGPLPDEHAAAALWSRLEPHLAPTATLENLSGVRRLRPDWTNHLLAALPENAASSVLRSGQWPQLVAAVNDAAKSTGQPATTLLDQAVRLLDLQERTESGQAPIPRHMLATVLAWRVHELTVEPPDDVEPDDLLDPEMEEFSARLLAEEHHRQEQARQDRRAGIGPGAANYTADTVPQPPDHEAPPDHLPPLEEPDFTLDADLASSVDDVELEALTTAWAASRDVPAHGTVGDAAAAAHGTKRDRVLALTAAAEAFYTGLYQGSPAQAHNHDRFGTDLTDTPFTVGYAPQEWDALVGHLRQHHQATDEELVDSSLAQWSSRGGLIDFFHDRAMFSIRDEHGTTVGLIGRDLSGSDKAVKYKNTATTPAFTKGSVLFGLYESAQHTPADFAGYAHTEGTADAIAVTLGSGGRLAGVATLGTALSDAQVEAIARRSPDRTVWSAADNDTSKATNAGLEAARKAMVAFADRGILQRSILVMADSDPADMHQHHHDIWASVLQSPEHASPTPLVQAHDLIGRRGAQIQASAETSVHALRQISRDVATLPPEHWSSVIETIAGQWPRGLGDPDHDQFYRQQLTTEVVDRALDWDPRDPRREQLDPDLLEAVADQLEADSIDPDQDAPKIQDARTQAERNRSRQDLAREQILAARREAMQRTDRPSAPDQTPQQQRRRDDDRRHTQDRGGPSLR